MADFREIVASKKPVLIDFFAEWCGPCKTLAPILTQVAKVLGDNIKVIKIDIDKNPILAQKLNIRSVPTLVIYKEESLMWRQSGIVPKSELINTLKAFI